MFSCIVPCSTLAASDICEDMGGDVTIEIKAMRASVSSSSQHLLSYKLVRWEFYVLNCSLVHIQEVKIIIKIVKR
jgi:hypothetical protein